MSLADFDINLDGGDQGFDATAGQVLSLKLRSLPSAGIRSWLVQVFNPANFSRAQAIAVNPPRCSKNAPLLTLVGATSGQSVNPATVASAISVTLPAQTGDAWIIRGTVNGGIGANGKADPSLIRERMVVIRDDNGNRAVVATETTQYEDDGWAGALYDLLLNGTSHAATGSEPGYLTRQWFTTPGTFVLWSTPDDVPDGDTIELVAWAGGAAGGNARFQNAAGASMGGTAAAGGGARNSKKFDRAFIISQLPISYTVATGVTAPAAPTTQNTDQVSTAGLHSYWTGSGGVLVAAYGGAAGQALNLGSGGSGGGKGGPGVQGASGAANNGGQPGGGSSGAGTGGGGGFGGDEGNALGDNGFPAYGGGGAGGGSAQPIGGPTAGVGSAGGNADEGAGGGGAGGSMNGTAVSGSSRTGGRGGQSGPRSDGVQFGSGPLGGVAGSPGGDGADGVDRSATDANYYKSGDGGGGGASSPIVGTAGGRGGHGAAPGGGGGGGGPGRGANGTAWGGRGGNGARGQCAFTAY